MTHHQLVAKTRLLIADLEYHAGVSGRYSERDDVTSEILKQQRDKCTNARLEIYKNLLLIAAGPQLGTEDIIMNVKVKGPDGSLMPASVPMVALVPVGETYDENKHLLLTRRRTL